MEKREPFSLLGKNGKDTSTEEATDEQDPEEWVETCHVEKRLSTCTKVGRHKTWPIQGIR